MGTQIRTSQGFFAGLLIGTLSGLIGLGGAELRLQVLVGQRQLRRFRREPA